MSPEFSLRQMLTELCFYREMLYYFCLRDLKSRYKVIWIGLLWGGLQPILSVTALTVIMVKVVKITPEGIPYPLFAYSGTLAWQFFSSSVLSSYNVASTALRLITKTYIPRLIIPLTMQFLPVVDFLISLVVFTVLLLVFHQPLSPNVYLLPLYLALGFLTTIGATLWFLSLSLAIHEFRHVMSTLVACLYLMTPVFYSTAALPTKFAAFFYINPLVTVIEGMRWCLFSLGEPTSTHTAISVVSSIFLFATGIVLFSKISGKISDLI